MLTGNTFSQYKRHWALFCLILLTLSACSTERRINSQYDHLRPKLIAAAMAMQGKPYIYGGNNPNNGFDCSGLIHYSFQQVGLDVPRSSIKQFKASSPVYQNRLQAGDLVFFRTSGAFVSHVGIYIGNNQFVHAPGKGKKVKIQSMNSRYWQQRFAGGGTFF